MSKEKVLHCPIESKTRKTSKFFAAPTKEGATTGRFMPAGDEHGMGHRNPVGTESSPKGPGSGPIPQKAVAFNPSDAVL